MAGMNGAARKLFASALKAYPKFGRARVGLAFVNATEHKKEEAIKEIEAAIAISDEAYFHVFEALVYGFVGLKDKAREILNNILSGKYKGYAGPFSIGSIHYLLGDWDSGYEWIMKAYKEHDPALPWSNKWPILAFMREDPRFVELLGRMRLQ
jgi:tetratricopeptide (TPR) repeat protein